MVRWRDCKQRGWQCLTVNVLERTAQQSILHCIIYRPFKYSCDIFGSRALWADSLKVFHDQWNVECEKKEQIQIRNNSTKKKNSTVFHASSVEDWDEMPHLLFLFVIQTFTSKSPLLKADKNARLHIWSGLWDITCRALSAQCFLGGMNIPTTDKCYSNWTSTYWRVTRFSLSRQPGTENRISKQPGSIYCLAIV